MKSIPIGKVLKDAILEIEQQENIEVRASISAANRESSSGTFNDQNVSVLREMDEESEVRRPSWLEEPRKRSNGFCNSSFNSVFALI